MSSSSQPGTSLPSSRSTGFDPSSEAISPEVQAFGAIYLVAWTLLLAFVFVTRRKQRLLRAEVERLEAALDPEPVDGELDAHPSVAS